jgi:hypothetical protein
MRARRSKVNNERKSKCEALANRQWRTGANDYSGHTGCFESVQLLNGDDFGRPGKSGMMQQMCGFAGARTASGGRYSVHAVLWSWDCASLDEDPGQYETRICI